MKVRITPNQLSGTLDAIPSKSAAHRLAICAALSDKPTQILIGSTSQDIDATFDCLRSLGAVITKNENGFIIEPIKDCTAAFLDCAQSGSTFRFMLPVASAVCKTVSFTGHGRLPERPIGELKDAMSAHGVSFSNEKLPFTTNGRLMGGEFSLPGNISSQYVTGLLLALPLVKEESVIILTSSLESKAYVDMTLSALDLFGIKVDVQKDRYYIEGGQSFVSPGVTGVEGDWSNAAAMLAFGVLGKGVAIKGLDINSGQGDKAVLDLLAGFGAKTGCENGIVFAEPGDLHGCTIDINETPDLLPVLASVAACAEGETRFVNAKRLRLKESDRLETTADMLCRLGIKANTTEDSLVVFGGRPKGGSVSGYDDHRLVMAAAVLSSRCENFIEIDGAQAINKSYPTFFEDINRIGGKTDVITVW